MLDDLHVELWQWIVSQVLGVFIVLCLIIGFQTKAKQRLLLTFAIANVIGFFSMLLLENYGLAAMSVVNVGKNVAFMWTNKRESAGRPINKVLSYVLLVFFWVAGIVSVSIWWVVWTDWPGLGFQIITTWASWHGARWTTHVMKLSSLGFQVVFIINAFMFFNWIGIVSGLIVLGSILLYYIKFFAQKKTLA